MARFDRYMLSQLMVLFGFFALVLILVYWINQAVRLFDQLIADGQSAFVFLEFTALSLPGVIRVVLPIAAFAASVYVTNRMMAESEMVVVQATGYSPMRLARPVLVFGLIVGAIMMVLMHVLVPLSTRAYNERSAQIAQDVTARLLTEGQFESPVDGVTLYIRDITPQGELIDLFLSDTRNPAQSVTYTAATAYLVKADSGPQLVMRQGMAQTLQTATNRLFTTTFDDFAYNIGGLVQAGPRTKRGIRELSTWELLHPTPALEAETGKAAAVLLVEGNDRFDQCILAVVAALLGFSTLMVGGFSRFGVWRQIVGAILLVILVKAVETSVAGVARTITSLWPLTYLPSVVGFALVWLTLTIAARPMPWRRLRRTEAAE